MDGHPDHTPRPWLATAPAAQWPAAPFAPELALLRAQAQAEPERLFAHADQLRFRALHAQAPNTQRAYASDWRSFVRFCRQYGFEPLPASSVALESFIEASAVYSPEVPYKYFAPEVPRRNLKSASLTRAIAAIGAVHTWLHFPSPTAHPDVKHTLKINTRGRSSKTPKAPLTWDLIERALASYDDSPRERRSAALLAIGFSTLLRRSELVALRVEDFERTADAEDGTLRITKSKSDQAGEGDLRYVTPAARRQLERWLASAQLTRGPLFPRLNRYQAALERPLHANQVAVIFKDAARRAGLEARQLARIAGHSTRIGATHELARAGASLAQLMRAGGWQSPQMPAIYLRESEVTQGAMAQWARVQRERTIDSPRATSDAMTPGVLPFALA
jgi:integrase